MRPPEGRTRIRGGAAGPKGNGGSPSDSPILFAVARNAFVVVLLDVAQERAVAQARVDSGGTFFWRGLPADQIQARVVALAAQIEAEAPAAQEASLSQDPHLDASRDSGSRVRTYSPLPEGS